MPAVARHQRPAILRMRPPGLAAGAQRLPGWLAWAVLQAQQQLGLRVPEAPRTLPIQMAGLVEVLHQQRRRSFSASDIFLWNYVMASTGRSGRIQHLR